MAHDLLHSLPFGRLVEIKRREMVMEIGMLKALAGGLAATSLMVATSAYATPQIGISVYIDDPTMTGPAALTQGLTTGGLLSTPLTGVGSGFIVQVSSTGVPALSDPNFNTSTVDITT